MLNPRTLWQQWRNCNSNKMSPRFTLKRRHHQTSIGNYKDQNQDDVQAQGAVEQESQLEGSSCALEQQSSVQYPTSPVPHKIDNTLGQESITTTPQPMPQMTTSLETFKQQESVYSLTPPASSPFPPIVSAKRLATEIRSKHNKRRRGKGQRYRQCFIDRTNMFSRRMDWRNRIMTSKGSPNIDDDDHDDHNDSVAQCWSTETAKLSPFERNRYYWQICYGNSAPSSPTYQESSWSAQRLAPTKSW